MKPEENIHTSRINEILKAYKTIAAKEKLEKERKKYSRAKKRQFNIQNQSFVVSNSNINALTGVNANTNSTGSFQFDKYGILAPVYKRIESNSANQHNESINLDKKLNSLVEKAITTQNFPPLSDDFFTKIININSCEYFYFAIFKLLIIFSLL